MTKGKTGQKTWLPKGRNYLTHIERRKEVDKSDLAEIQPLDQCELNAISLYRTIVREMTYY